MNDEGISVKLPLRKRFTFFINRFRILPLIFWARLATIFGIADFLTWSLLADISTTERLKWTLGIAVLVLVATIITVLRSPTTDEKLALARALQYSAREFFNKYDYEQARRLLEQAIKNDNESPTAWGLLGRTLIRLADFPSAVTALSKAIELTKVNRSLYLHCRGQSYVFLKQYGRALDDLEEALKLEPNRTNTLRWRALVWILLGRLDNALHDTDTALKFEPRYICARATKAIVLDLLGQREKAEDELKRCKSLQPIGADDFYSLAQANNQLGNSKETVSLLNAAFVLDAKYRARVAYDPLLANISLEM